VVGNKALSIEHKFAVRDIERPAVRFHAIGYVDDFGSVIALAVERDLPASFARLQANAILSLALEKEMHYRATAKSDGVGSECSK
jgi:hypothetical protein